MKMDATNLTLNSSSASIKSIGIDRRENSRYYIDEKKRYFSLNINNNQIQDPQIINISLNGFSLRSKTPLTNDTKVPINLELGDDQTIFCLGKIIWNYQNNGEYFYGINIYYFKEEDHRASYRNIYNHFVNDENVVNRRKSERRSDELKVKSTRRSKHDRRNSKTLFIKCLRYNRMKSLMSRNKYFYLTEQLSGSQNKVVINGNEYINFASNNYLGLASHPEVKEAAIKAMEKYGVGMCGSRVLNGTCDLHNQLENSIADFVGGQSCILYTTGYSANVGLISAIVDSGDIVIIDEQAHASIIDGCNLSRSDYIKYRHNDINDLEKKLDKLPLNQSKLLVTEGVFSMEGDLGAIDKLYDITKKYDIAFAVDDAHAIGVLGIMGRGSSEHFSLQGKIDVIIGTNSKALGGIGGFVVASQEIVHYLKHNSRSFIFSASLPPSVCAATIKAIEIIKSNPGIISKLWNNVNYLRDRLVELGFHTGKSASPIIPLIFNSESTTYEVNRMLINEGIYASPVVYPAVKRNESRIRIGVMATHTRQDLDCLIERMSAISKKIGAIT